MESSAEFRINWKIIEEFYPASLHIDFQMNVVHAGRSLQKQIPCIEPGVGLFQFFSWDEKNIDQSFADAVNTGTAIDLVANEYPVRIRGAIVSSDDGYLIIARHLPNPFALGMGDLRMSDFAPSDPIVSAMLLVGAQEAMLEEARQAATELARARQQSAEFLQRFSRVAGFMAHDFNNLLSIIRLNVELLRQDGTLAHRSKRLTQIIHDTTIRGSEISRSLMTLSSQRYDSALPVQIDELIRDNFAFLKSIAGSRVSISLSLDANDALITASREGILNCLVNLVINARDAMPTGGDIKISTGLKQLYGPVTKSQPNERLKDYVVIKVRDNGPGMAPDVAGRAFEPLFSTKHNGNGIGLASVFDFTLEMGGYSRIETRPGDGVCVIMKLPKSEPEPQASSGNATAEIDGVPTNLTPRLPGLSVLLVEDEPYALEALSEMLESWGLNVRPCAGVAEAQAALCKNGGADIEVLLSDIVLADGSGIELAEDACATSPKIEVILMSGFAPPSEKLKTNWQYIRKPIESAILREKILAAFKNMAKAF